MTTNKWSYIPFFPGEPTRDPREPPIPPDYEHIVSLNPRKMAVMASIYEGKARIHLVVPEDSAEQVGDAFADAYAGSTLGDPTDSTPFYRSAVEEVTHVIFRTNQHHDFPVRVYMRGPKGHGGWWSDPMPEGHDIEYRDTSSHLFDGVPALYRAAPRARVYLQFIHEHVGAMEEKTTVRSLFGTPHKDRIRYLAEGKVWSATDRWYFPAQPTSSSYTQSKSGLISRPTQSSGQVAFRDVLTRRNASQTFRRTEVRATVVTPIGDTESLGRVMEFLNTWCRQFRFWGVDLADYDLWRPEVLRPPLLKGKEAQKEWYAALDRAVEECDFYPHGGNPVGKRDLTMRECAVGTFIPWERRHKCITYQPPQTGTTQSLPKDLPADKRAPPAPGHPPDRGRNDPALEPPSSNSANSPRDVMAPSLATPADGQVRMGSNRKDRVPVVFSRASIHTHVFGKPGGGKSTLTVNVVLGVFRVWHDQAVFVDPHGDGIKEVMAALTPAEARRTVLIRPASMSRDGKVAIGMNPLRIENREHLSEEEMIKVQDIIRGDIAQIVAAKVGSREIGDKIRRHMGNVVQALLNIPEWETTLYDADLVLRNVGKTPERGEVARMTKDQDAKNYIEGDLVKTQSRDLQSSQNKSAFFSHPFFRAAMCQRGEGVVTMKQLLDENDLILIDLSGLTGEVKEYMGSAYLTMLWLAMHQEREQETGRVLRVFVDEWPEIASESFNEILHAGRKSGVRLWLVTQALGDIPDGRDGKLDLLSRVKGNVSTWITFQTDSDTAKHMNDYAHLERFGYDYRHYMNWPPFYAGMAYGNDYADIKIDPLPLHQPDAVRAEVKKIVDANTWRYAKVDNSKDSPLRIGKAAEMNVLEVFARRGTMTRDQAILLVPQFRSKVWIIIDNLERYHFLVKHRDPGKKDRFQITELGFQELKKYGRNAVPPAAGSGSKMSGGDPHDRTLEKARSHLKEQGCQVGPKIDPRVGKSSPDFVHTLGDGTLVNDEVEDGAAHPGQVLDNYQKAKGKPVWFWAVDLDTARRIVGVLGDRPNYQVYVDQGMSFSRHGPGVPKEEEPISEEQDLVELSIVSLIKEGRFIMVEGRRGFAFKDIVRSLPKPLAYQKVRSVLEGMVGDTVYAIRERRPEQGGPLVILNDTPEDERLKETVNGLKPTETGPPTEADSSDSDVKMVFDTCVALSNTGKTFIHRDRGARVSLRFSDVYDALPRRMSLARFKEVVTILLQQDDISEVVLRPDETAILVIDPPETGIVDNTMALKATPEEIYKGILPAAMPPEKSAPKVTPPVSTPASSQPSAVLSPPATDSTAGSPRHPYPSPKEGVWDISLRTAREMLQRRRKSFLTEDGKNVAVKFDTLYGMVKTALVRENQGTDLNPNLLIRTLKDHGVEVESRAPPPHWTQTWHERFCLFPLGMLQGTTQGSAAPSTGPVPASMPSQPTGRDLMVQNLVAHANSLLEQGKVIPVEGKKAVRVSDLCAFYAPWNETEMSAYLSLHKIPTERVWIQNEKRKVRVWFAWD